MLGLVILLAAVGQGPAAGPRRVVSLIPSVTDLIVAIGAADRLVARTSFDLNPAVRALPSIGGTTDPSIERIVALRPDWVIVWREPSDPAREAQLASSAIPFDRFGTETLGELHRSLARLGTAFGLERVADSLGRAIDDSLDAVRRLTLGRERPKVLFLFGIDPPFTAGPGTFVDDVLTIGGGQNLFGDVSIKWPVVSLEAVVARKPALIVWARPGTREQAIAALRSRRGWSSLRAVRAGKVIVVDRDLFNRPGPAIATAARTLALAIVSLCPAARSDQCE